MNCTTYYIRLYVLIVFGGLIVGTSTAQIEDADVMATEHPTDTSAIAEYIDHYAHVTFESSATGMVLLTEYKEIIKVYNTKGEKYGTFKIAAYKQNSKKEKVYGIKGATYNYVNGAVQKTKLEKKDVFIEEKSENLKYTIWAMPDVRPGSVIEIKYTIKSPWIYTIPRFDFQYEIPVREVEYNIQIPNYLTYTPISTGIVPMDRKEKTRNGDYGRETVFILNAQNIEGLKEDEYVLNIDDYRGSLKYELHSMAVPGRAYETYSKSWTDIAKNLQENPDFGKQLTKKLKDYRAFVEELRPLEHDAKVQRIYDHVRTEYAWNKRYGKYADVGLKQLIKTKKGNIADINILLINLLNQAEVEAKPLLLKSRNNGLLNQFYPTVTELNYVIAYLPQQDGSFLLLDATSKYTPIGQLPTRAININGLLVQGRVGEIIEIGNPNQYSYQALSKYEIDIENGSLIGSGNSIRKGYGATRYRIDLDEDDDEENQEEEDIEDEDEEEGEEEEEIVVENETTLTSTEGIEDIYSPIKVAFDEKLYDVIDVIGNQVFINATLDFGMDENPFIEDKRKMPVFYRSKQKVRNVATIVIPEGYVIESLPEATRMTLADRSVAFTYGCHETIGKININYSFEIKSDFYSSEIYPDLKEIYDRIIEKTKEKIVLRKA